MSLDKLRYPPRSTENFDELPVGFYLPWEKAMQGALPEWFVECNGQLLDDAESTLHGQYIPNLNGVAKVKDVNFTNASTTASMVTTKDIYAGASVTSASVPVGTVVLSIDSTTTITLSNAATATGIVESTIGGNGGVFLRGGSTSGVWKADQMQGHWHNQYHAGLVVTAGSNGNGLSLSGIPNNTKSTPNDSIKEPLTDGTNGTPRTGTVTCDSNRLFRIWKRTA